MSAPRTSEADGLASGAGRAAAALLGAVPLAVLPSGGLGYLPIKWALVATLVPLGLAAAPLLGRRPPAVLAWGAMLAVLALAALAGVAPLAAALGAPQRHLGWVAWLAFASAWALGANVGQRASDRTLSVRAAVTGGIGVSGVALLQALDLDPVGLGDRTADRVGSTWGSAQLLGGYLVVVLPVAWHVARADLDGRWRAAGRVGVATGVIALVATGTRSAWLGAVAVALVLAAPSLRTRGWHAAALVGLLLGAVTVVLAVARPDDLTRSTAGGRLEQWALTLQVIGDRPLLGAGPDAYRVVFPAAIDDEFEREHASALVNDRAHDLPLDTAVSAGVAGVAALGALLVSAARCLRPAMPLPLGRALAAAGTGYLVHLAFAFQDPALDVLTWLLVGIGAGLARVQPTPPAPRGRRRAPAPPSAPRARAALGALALGMLVWTGRGVVADQRLGAGIEAAERGEVAAALRSIRAAGDLEPERAHHREALGRVARSVAAQTGDAGLAAEAVAALERALDLLPDDPTLLLDRAEALLASGRLAEAQVAFDELLNRRYPRSYRAHLGAGTVAASLEDLAMAEQRWREAVALSRTDPAPLLNLGLLYERTGRRSEAVEAYEAALARDPANSAARTALAGASVAAG